MPNPPLYLGIDIGGTNIRGALVNAEGHIHDSIARPLPSDAEGRRQAPMEIATHYRDAAAGIGLAIAGTVSSGVLTWSANLGLKDIDYATELGAYTSGPVAVLNDARAAGLAEASVGAGRGEHSVLSITVGTGIGGAIIIGGRLLEGTGDAGEIGHMVSIPSGPDCTCGRQGCWERFVGGRALSQTAARLYPHASDALGYMIQEAEEKREPALGAIDHATSLFHAGVDNICAVLAPDVIVLGGGVMARRGLIAQRYRASLGSLRWGARTRVDDSVLGDRAGQIGAALAAERAITERRTNRAPMDL